MANVFFPELMSSSSYILFRSFKRNFVYISAVFPGFNDREMIKLIEKFNCTKEAINKEFQLNSFRISSEDEKFNRQQRNNRTLPKKYVGNDKVKI